MNSHGFVYGRRLLLHGFKQALLVPFYVSGNTG